MNYKEIKEKEEKNKKRILSVCPQADEKCGIYILARQENGIKYAYVGQAKHLLTRLAQHLTGFQHIDNSIRKHGFYNEGKLDGYHILTFHCEQDRLDEMERHWVQVYANRGYQLRNKTLGGQDTGKAGLDVEHKQPKGYYDGLQQGYLNARREIAKLFKANLIAQINGNDGVRKQKALDKFNEFINIGGTEDEQSTEESDV